MRRQLALNVRNLDEAVDYYGKLFDAEPHKRCLGYANFTIEPPPLKLVPFENEQAAERLNHLGVEVFDDMQVNDAARRLAEAGILNQVQRDETCCHTTQDNAWSHEPAGPALGMVPHHRRQSRTETESRWHGMLFRS